MNTISLLAQKGGVGKTTLALHWAVEASKHSPHVAIIDMDIQASATRWYERRTHNTPRMLRANTHTIAQAVEACQQNNMEWVFVDTMPRTEASSVAAAQVADLIVLPCGPSVLDIEAVHHSITIARAVTTPCVIIINRGRHSSSINTKAAQVLTRYGVPVCPVYVMRRAALEDAFIDGRAIGELAPRSKAAQEITAAWQWIQQQLYNVP